MINIMNKSLKKLNNKLTDAIIKIIETKKGGKRNKPAKKRSGKLLKSKAIVDFDGKEFTFDLEAVDYFKYLDEGTKYIRNPYLYIESIINSKEVQDLLNEFLIEHYKESIDKIWQSQS